MTNNTYIDYKKTLINIPITNKPSSAYDLLYGFSHKLSLGMDETILLLDLLIKENKDKKYFIDSFDKVIK
jgi:hypothetical protein